MSKSNTNCTKREVEPQQGQSVDERTVELYAQSKKLQSTEELKKRPNDAALCHKGGYFHYTTLDKFQMMLANRRIFLSHASYMNDKLEAVDIDPQCRKTEYTLFITARSTSISNERT